MNNVHIKSHEKICGILKQLGVKSGARVTVELLVLVDVVSERPFAVYGQWYSEVLSAAALRLGSSMGAIAMSLTRVIRDIWSSQERSDEAAKLLGLTGQPTPKEFVLSLYEVTRRG